MPIHTDQQNIIHIDNAYASAKISLFGGHVLSFTPKTDNRERLWVSERAIFDSKKAIRGGVPVCWPWFAHRHGRAQGTLPSHGYLRTQHWQLAESTENRQGAELVLRPQFTAAEGFTGEAQVWLKVKVAKTLSLTLTTQNSGTLPFDFTCALHSYFAVADIADVQLRGLSGDYQDNTQDLKLLDTPADYRFNQETDRIHLTQQKQCQIECQGNITQIGSAGHDSIVVWNPWAANSQALVDMADDGYQRMLCVESAVTQGYRLTPGQQHSLEQVIG